MSNDLPQHSAQVQTWMARLPLRFYMGAEFYAADVSNEPAALEQQYVRASDVAKLLTDLAQEQTPQWQPISTAPRDGREILCTWIHELSDGRTHWAGVMHVLSWWPHWHGEGQGAWVLDGDFAARFEPDGIHQTPPVEGGEPTHWMPLPPSPVSPAPNGENP